MKEFFKQLDAKIEIKDFPALFREMADDIEKCLAEGDPLALTGCLIAINMIFQFHLAPAIFAYKNAVKKGYRGV